MARVRRVVVWSGRSPIVVEEGEEFVVRDGVGGDVGQRLGAACVAVVRIGQLTCANRPHLRLRSGCPAHSRQCLVPTTRSFGHCLGLLLFGALGLSQVREFELSEHFAFHAQHVRQYRRLRCLFLNLLLLDFNSGHCLLLHAHAWSHC